MKKIKKKLLKKLRFALFLTTLSALFLFFVVTSVASMYERQFTNRIYPGIYVGDVDLSTKTRIEAQHIFEAKNKSFSQATFTFYHNDQFATASAKELQMGFNTKLIAEQAYTIGRTGNIFADTFNKMLAWHGKLVLPPSYSVNEAALLKSLSVIEKNVTKAPVNAEFEIKNNRVLGFRPSEEGTQIDMTTLEEAILSYMPHVLTDTMFYTKIAVPIKILKPDVSLSDINTLGIKEQVGEGISHFQGSIPNRIHNIVLASSRLDGIIIKPGETFSFNKALGDISKFTGYKEAYIIKDGKTILGDGGGVCQVSTTLFRAILNSGLPIVERHAHAYRVGYYEQDAPPGLDATIYDPSYDLRFKNDTNSSILIKAYADAVNTTLIFDLYGTSDGREVALTKPVIANEIPAPPDQYNDDPTLPKGTVKQVDFKAVGSTVKFSRTVTKDSKVLISETFTSNYRPWQAVFLRGTKEQ